MIKYSLYIINLLINRRHWQYIYFDSKFQRSEMATQLEFLTLSEAIHNENNPSEDFEQNAIYIRIRNPSRISMILPSWFMLTSVLAGLQSRRSIETTTTGLLTTQLNESKELKEAAIKKNKRIQDKNQVSHLLLHIHSKRVGHYVSISLSQARSKYMIKWARNSFKSKYHS